MTWQKPLHSAISEGDISHLKVLLESHHHDINETDNNAEISPLMLAVLRGRRDMTELLLHHRADISHRDWRSNTAVTYAVLWNKPDVLKLLLKHGAARDAVNKDGLTPLMLAVRYNFTFCVKQLLDFGASLTLRYPEGRTVMEEALEKKHFGIIKFITSEMSRRSKFAFVYYMA